MNNAVDPLEWHELQHNTKMVVHETIAALARQVCKEQRKPDADIGNIQSLREEMAGYLGELIPTNFDNPTKMRMLIRRCNERVHNLEKPEP